MNGRMVHCVVDGHDYEIPEIWVAGFCATGRTAEEAVQHWHEQAQLEAKHYHVSAIANYERGAMPFKGRKEDCPFC